MGKGYFFIFICGLVASAQALANSVVLNTCVNFSGNWRWTVERINGAVPQLAYGDFTVTQVACKQVSGLAPAHQSVANVWLPLSGEVVARPDGYGYRAQWIDAETILVQKLRLSENGPVSITESCRYQRVHKTTLYAWCEKGAQKREMSAHNIDSNSEHSSAIRQYWEQLLTFPQVFSQQMLNYLLPPSGSP